MADEMQSGEVQKNATATVKVSSIKEFPDVRDPNHWAYRDLEKLVDHGCVAGFPDGTFQGEQPATRFEMAALLEACLDSTAKRLAASQVPSRAASHPVNMLTLISLLSIIILYFLQFQKVKNIETNIEAIKGILKKRKSYDRYSLIIGIIGTATGLIGLTIQLVQSFNPQHQESSQISVEQEIILGEGTSNSLAIAPSQEHFLENKLAAILSLPGRTVEAKVALSQENIGKTPHQVLDNTWLEQASFSTNLSLPKINGPPAG